MKSWFPSNHIEGESRIIMDTINLIAGDHFKFGDLEFDLKQFELPEGTFADFSKAQAKMRFDEVNGENVNSGEVNKIILPVYDVDVVEALAKVGQSHEQLKAMEVVVTDNLHMVSALIKDGYAGEVTLSGIKIKPKWIQRPNGGSWGGVQVVAENVEVNVSSTSASPIMEDDEDIFSS